MNRKKIICLCSLGVFVLSLVLITNLKQVNASEDKKVVTKKDEVSEVKEKDEDNFVYKQEYLDEYFGHLEDTDIVLQLEGGGFLFTDNPIPGEADATLVDENGNVIAEYDIETDPNAETVAEAKARLLNNQ